MNEFAIELAGGKAYVYTPYDPAFVSKIKLLGGRWNPAEKCWMVSDSAVEDARRVMREVYGRDDQPVAETVDVQLVFDKDVDELRAPVALLGRIIASASGRDSGASVGTDVLFISGCPTSGGSVKNWRTVVHEGSVVRLPRLPKGAVENPDLPDGVRMEVLGGETDRAALEAEKAKLLARIAEIDELLAK